MDNEPQNNPIGNEHPLRGCMIGAALAAALAAIIVGFCCYSTGCASMPDLPAGAYDFVTNAVQRALVETPQPTTAAKPDRPAKPDAAAESLVFRYGGVAANPAADDRCRISALRIDGDSMSFRWESGIPGDWKRKASEKGALVLACAFYWSEKEQVWLGGKFDWIDEHRSSRSFENIRDGYGGWDAGAFFGAPQRAFCVVSADGKRRSNLLEVAK